MNPGLTRMTRQIDAYLYVKCKTRTTLIDAIDYIYPIEKLMTKTTD